MTRRLTVGEAVTIQRGTTYKSALIGQSGPVLLGLGTILRNGGFRGDSLRTYGGDSPEKLLVRPGELYASLKDVTQSADLLGAVARVPVDGPTGRLTQDTVRLDLTGLVTADYLYWVMRTPQYRAYCRAHATGTTNLGLPRDDFFAFPFPAPTARTENLVALLGALDDKIESNRRSAEIELELAATLLVGGTEAIRVGDIADVDKGLSYKGSGLDDGSATDAIPMVNLANFTTSGALKPEGLKYYTGDFKPKHRLAAWDLVVANTDLTQSREILGRGFLVPSTLHGALHTHHTSVLRFRENPELAPVLWARLQSTEFRDRAKGFATGTTVTALPREALLDYEFSVPSDPGPPLAAAHGLIEHSWQLEAESVALTRTRDALLPELLSGRIRVPEAAAVVQDG